MIYIVWRRSGILVLVFLGLSFWILGQFYKDQTAHNHSYMAWSFFSAAVATLLQSVLLFVMAKGEQTGSASAEQPPPSTWSSVRGHSFFAIPVVFWPLILGAASAWFFTSGSGTSSPAGTDAAAPAETEPRMINLLNPSGDTLFCTIIGTDGVVLTKTNYPNSYARKKIDADVYEIRVTNAKGEVVLHIPSADATADGKKFSVRKDSAGKPELFRIIDAPTDDADDYDDAWINVDGKHDMVLVDITSICNDSVTEKEIEKTDWTQFIRETYSGTDLIEPRCPDGTGTILDTGADIPVTVGKSGHVFALFAVPSDKPVTAGMLADKIVVRCPRFSGE
ncbi:MAG TPA: hypothetical protein VFU15_05690 [Bacteroidia bacterium]|nr:hypothetical protein [Bacteroidia bacterium]